MKCSIFLCALGMLLVCQETLCIDFPALLEGNCKPEDVPQSDLAGCVNLKCQKTADGNISFLGKGCGLRACPDGRENNGEPDLTKKYPDCCPRINCDE